MRRFQLVLLAAWIPVGIAAAADVPVATTRDLVSQWVQTQQLISRTQSDWERDREMLEQTKALYQQELKKLADSLTRVSTNSSQVDQQRARAEEDLSRATQALAAARQYVTHLEAEIRSFVPVLPPPLIEQALPLLNRVPTNATSAVKAPVTERLQAVVGLLNEIDKFNGSISVVSERQRDGQGHEVSVDTLYVGLSGAYFSDPTGRVAGIGTPAADGWKWELKSDLGDSIRGAIAMYRNSKPAAFVGLPARIQ